MHVHRVEDTDLARSTQQSEQNLMEELRWLGINWDEGEDAPVSAYSHEGDAAGCRR